MKKIIVLVFSTIFIFSCAQQNKNEKLDKRAAALRDNLKRRKIKAKSEKADQAKKTDTSKDKDA